VWDKRAKLAFVQRLIDHTARNGLCVVGCVAEKVISGLEPNKTNELLQALARLAKAKSSGIVSSDGRARTFTRTSATPASQKTTANLQTRQNPLNNATRRASSGSSRQKTSAKADKAPLRTSVQEARKSVPKENESEPLQVPRKESEIRTSDLGSLTEVKDSHTEEVVVPKPVAREQYSESHQDILIVSNEDDISKHIPQMKINLKHLRNVLRNIDQLSSRLQESFQQKAAG